MHPKENEKEKERDIEGVDKEEQEKDEAASSGP